MSNKLDSKQDKIDFIIYELKRLKGLEFISNKEIEAMNYACLILRNHKKRLKDTPVNIKKQYITNCPVNKVCQGCYRQYVCIQESISR